MVYGNKKKNDKIASSTGQDGFADGKRLPAGILTSLLTKTLYPASAVCYSGSATVFKDGLSWYYTNAQRLLGFTQGSGIEEDTTLFDPLLCRATLVKKRAFEKLLASIFEQSWAIGILDETPEGAIDSTGLETHHISCHFVNCTKRPSYFRRIWPKITVVCDTQTHLIASCIVTRGPGYDFCLFEEAVGEAAKQVRFKRMLADGGYDCESNHRIAREIFGIEAVIKLNLRGFNSQPHGPYRRQMKENFDRKVYNNRWQIESVFSRHKRLLGSALRNRTEVSRERECLLRILTHNLMIIRCAA
jgi:hypothetical protein